MNANFIHVIGLGVTEEVILCEALKNIVHHEDVIIGCERQ
jgi:precorrin-6B methylase 1